MSNKQYDFWGNKIKKSYENEKTTSKKENKSSYQHTNFSWWWVCLSLLLLLAIFLGLFVLMDILPSEIVSSDTYTINIYTPGNTRIYHETNVSESLLLQKGLATKDIILSVAPNSFSNWYTYVKNKTGFSLPDKIAVELIKETDGS